MEPLKKPRRKWTPEQQIKVVEQINVLRAGGKTDPEACAAMGINPAQYYDWRRKTAKNLPAVVKPRGPYKKKTQDAAVIDLNRPAPGHVSLDPGDDSDITVMVFNGKPQAVGAAIARMNRGHHG